MNNDDYLKKLITQSNDDCAINFIDKVMFECYKYETKRIRILKYKKYALLSLPIILMIIFLFIPGINEFIFNIINNITLKNIFEYYIMSSIIIIISFYIILLEKIYKFIKLRLIKSSFF